MFETKIKIYYELFNYMMACTHKVNFNSANFNENTFLSLIRAFFRFEFVSYFIKEIKHSLNA